MILSLSTVVTTSAVSEEESQWLYEDVYYEKYYDPLLFSSFSYYKELYVHYPKDQTTPDWVLVEACGYGMGTEGKGAYLLGKTFLYTESGCCRPFRYHYGVYDVELEQFYSLESVWGMDYDGLEEAIDNLGIGRLYGDIDADGAITISDATKMQRCIAGLEKYRADSVRYFKYKSKSLMYLYTDFDRDGERTIMDATAIQREVAKLPKDQKPLWYDGIASSIKRRNKYFPDNCDIEFTSVLEGKDIYLNLDNRKEDCAVLIRNTDEFYKVFNCNDERFNDEYFETKSLVVYIRYCYVMLYDEYYKFDRMAVQDDCLYVRAENTSTDIESENKEYVYHTICEVDANAVKDVKYIREGLIKY